MGEDRDLEGEEVISLSLPSLSTLLLYLSSLFPLALCLLLLSLPPPSLSSYSLSFPFPLSLSPPPHSLLSL